MSSDPSQTMSGQFSQYLQRAYALDGTTQAQELYDEWASSYDADLNGAEYVFPQHAVKALIDGLRNSSIPDQVRILDAGCGTGLVGVSLQTSSLAGRFVLDGIDISEGMLSVARKKGMYTSLETADLSQPLMQKEGTYDGIICVGTLTKGHVGPSAIRELVKVAKASGGIVVATIHDDVWVSGGYKEVVDALQTQGVVEVIGTEASGILKSQTAGGRIVVLQKK